MAKQSLLGDCLPCTENGNCLPFKKKCSAQTGTPPLKFGASPPASPGMSPQLTEQRRTVRFADWLPPPSIAAGGYQALDGLPQAEAGESCWDNGRSCFLSHVPIIKWLPRYDFKNNLFHDLSGGSTIALICLVQTLAHASIATTSVIQGPYCAFVPPFIYALLGTSQHASISSGAVAAILIADQLSEWPDIADRTELASVLALVSGLMLCLLGLCKFAFLVRFLSQSLLSGFITGGSVLIMIGQLANLIGIETMPHGVGPMVTLANVIEKAPMEHNRCSVALGVTLLVLLELLMRLKKYVVGRLNAKGTPANQKPKWLKVVKIGIEMKELILIFFSILFAWSTSSAGPEEGEIITMLPTIGVIPPGLPQYRVPWNGPATQKLLSDRLALHRFVFGSFLVALTTFLTTYSTAKKQALLHGYELGANQEMFALGMASTCGSFFGSFPPSGSLSRTSLASEVGVKSQMSSLVKIFVVGGSLKFLTPVLFFLPKPALAAIILRSTWSLVDVDRLRVLIQKWKPRREGGHRRDLAVWIIAFTLTIWQGVICGVGVAVILSLLMIVKDAARPRMVVLCRLPGSGNVWRDREVWPEGASDPGLLVIEFRGPLSFASAGWFQEEIQRIRIRYDELEQKNYGDRVKVIVLAFGSVHDLDPTAVAMLKELLEAWQGSVQCIVADAKGRVRLIIEEHFGVAGNGKKALLDQPAFMIGLDQAVELAQGRLAHNGQHSS